MPDASTDQQAAQQQPNQTVVVYYDKDGNLQSVPVHLAEDGQTLVVQLDSDSVHQITDAMPQETDYSGQLTEIQQSVDNLSTTTADAQSGLTADQANQLTLITVSSLFLVMLVAFIFGYKFIGGIAHGITEK